MLTFDSSDVAVLSPMSFSSTKRKRLSSDEVNQLVVEALDDNKGEDIVTIPLSGKADFADYMVIASGTSQRHVSSLADRVVEAAKREGIEPLSIEGLEASEWVLVDLGDVIVHVFKPESRKLYSLEKMWAV